MLCAQGVDRHLFSGEAPEEFTVVVSAAPLGEGARELSLNERHWGPTRVGLRDERGNWGNVKLNYLVRRELRKHGAERLWVKAS